MKRIRIFISSVQSEFAQERAMLSQYIRTDALLGKFFETFLFEDVPANEASPQQVYLGEVEMSDVYLGLYGNKYGYEDAEGVSPTEREYRESGHGNRRHCKVVQGQGIAGPRVASGRGFSRGAVAQERPGQ